MEVSITRLLTLGIVISLTACASHQPYYGEQSTADRTNTGNSFYGLLYNWGEAHAYTIPKEDRNRHQRCVFFTLDKADPGQTCSWHGPDSGANGVVKLIGRYPQGGKVCHILFTNLTYRNKTKQFKDVACYSPVRDKWTFISKT